MAGETAAPLYNEKQSIQKDVKQTYYDRELFPGYATEAGGERPAHGRHEERGDGVRNGKRILYGDPVG